MRSEKEMREFLDSVDGCLDIVNQSWGDAIEWVLAGDKEAVVCPLLADVLAKIEIESYYDRGGINVIMVDDVKEILSKYFR